tara:strand:+ start:293 stop:616 length:324 start_codon:yes stop_codon:yes gene_type:complete
MRLATRGAATGKLSAQIHLVPRGTIKATRGEQIHLAPQGAATEVLIGQIHLAPRETTKATRGERMHSVPQEAAMARPVVLTPLVQRAATDGFTVYGERKGALKAPFC